MSERTRRVLAALAVLSATVLTGCSQTISGTPQPDPDALNAIASGVDTTCEEYADMADSDKRAVIKAIAEENPLVRSSPELWVGVAGALCTFSDPEAKVREVLEGQGVR